MPPFTFEEMARLEKLVAWHEGSARSCRMLADSLSKEGLDEASQRNRSRAAAHRDTADFLARLKPQSDGGATVFRDHLKPKDRAQIRAPP